MLNSKKKLQLRFKGSGVATKTLFLIIRNHHSSGTFSFFNKWCRLVINGKGLPTWANLNFNLNLNLISGAG